MGTLTGEAALLDGEKPSEPSNSLSLLQPLVGPRLLGGVVLGNRAFGANGTDRAPHHCNPWKESACSYVSWNSLRFSSRWMSASKEKSVFVIQELLKLMLGNGAAAATVDCRGMHARMSASQAPSQPDLCFLCA